MEKNIKEAIRIIEDVRKSMPECTNKAFLKGALNELNEALRLSPVVRRYYHPCVGYGDFVREYRGLYGLGLVIRLDDGREWFAPINEFIRVR